MNWDACRGMFALLSKKKQNTIGRIGSFCNAFPDALHLSRTAP